MVKGTRAPKVQHLKTKPRKKGAGTVEAKAPALVSLQAILTNIAKTGPPLPQEPTQPNTCTVNTQLNLQEMEWAMPYLMSALPNNRQLNPRDTTATQAMVQDYHEKKAGGFSFFSPAKPEQELLAATMLERGQAQQHAKSLLPKKHRKRKLTVNKENAAPNPRPTKTRAQKAVASKIAAKTQELDKRRAQWIKPKLAWPQVLKLMVEHNLFATKRDKPSELCMFGRTVLRSLEEATGYGHSQLRNMRHLFSQGQIPSQVIGRPMRIPNYLVDELRKMLGKECKLDEHFHILIQKLSVYLNMSETDQLANSVEWRAISKSTIAKIHEKVGDSKRAAEVQSLARHLAGNDLNAFLTLCLSMDVLKPICGIKPKEEGMERERTLNPNWIWNFDASAGKTFNAEPIVRALKNAVSTKLVLNKGETDTMTQQFNLIQAVNGAGKMMSPVIGIRADQGVEAGSPLIIQLGQEELGIMQPFYKPEIAPPLLVVYARGDKACLTTLFLERIVLPVLDSEFAELEAKDGRHIITCDGVGENLKLVNDLEALDWWNARRRELVKLAANATHKTQVCDLLKLFHWIKTPEKFIKKINAERHRKQYEKMAKQMESAKPALTAPKWKQFAEVLSLVFYVVYPKMSSDHISSRFENLGMLDCDLRQALSQCGTIPTESVILLYERQYPACKLEMAAKGFLSSAFLESLGLPVSARNPDGLADKSQLCMLLTGEARRNELVARELAHQLKTQKAADAKVALQEKQVRANLVLATKATKKGKGTYTKKIRTQKNMLALRAESDRTALLPAGDAECLNAECGMKWSVFQKHEDEYKAEMRQCKHCKRYVCCLCLFALEDFINGHESHCLRQQQCVALLGGLQQAAIQQIKARAQAQQPDIDDDDEQQQEADEDEENEAEIDD